MPLPVIADTIRASVEGTMPNGAGYANVLHFRKTGALTYSGAIAILDPILFGLWNAAAGGFQALSYWMSANWRMVRIRYTPLDGTSATTIIPHALVGAEPSQPLPPQVALVVTHYTALRGRRNRGRTYLGGFTEGSNDADSRFYSTGVTAVQGRWDQFLLSLAGTGVSHVVSSYIPPAKSENVVSYLVNSQWDTQRRRTH